MILELCIIIIIFIIGLRGIIILCIRLRAVDALQTKNIQHMKDRKYSSMTSYSKVDNISFLKMCIMVNKWTVNQFYPFISNKE